MGVSVVSSVRSEEFYIEPVVNQGLIDQPLATQGGQVTPKATAVAARVPPEPPCLLAASQFHNVNAWIVRAILWGESRNKPSAINHNGNGTVDVGIAQINSIHFKELARYGIAPKNLMNACTGTYVAAWHLAKQVQRYGNTWAAVGGYHSQTAHLNAKYAKNIQTILHSWGQLGVSVKP